MVYKFTKSAEKVLEIANELALDFGHDYIGTEHLLIGIMREGDSIAIKILVDLDVELPKLYNEIVKDKFSILFTWKLAGIW